MSGTVDSFPPSEVSRIASALAAIAGGSISPQSIDIKIEPASVRLTAELSSDDEPGALMVITRLSATLRSPAAASEKLGLTVQSIDELSILPRVRVHAASPPPFLPAMVKPSDEGDGRATTAGFIHSHGATAVVVSVSVCIGVLCLLCMHPTFIRCRRWLGRQVKPSAMYGNAIDEDDTGCGLEMRPDIRPTGTLPSDPPPPATLIAIPGADSMSSSALAPDHLPADMPTVDRVSVDAHLQAVLGGMSSRRAAEWRFAEERRMVTERAIAQARAQAAATPGGHERGGSGAATHRPAPLLQPGGGRAAEARFAQERLAATEQAIARAQAADQASPRADQTTATGGGGRGIVGGGELPALAGEWLPPPDRFGPLKELAEAPQPPLAAPPHLPRLPPPPLPSEHLDPKVSSHRRAPLLAALSPRLSPRAVTRSAARPLSPLDSPRAGGAVEGEGRAQRPSPVLAASGARASNTRHRPVRPAPLVPYLMARPSQGHDEESRAERARFIQSLSSSVLRAPPTKAGEPA